MSVFNGYNDDEKDVSGIFFMDAVDEQDSSH